MRTRGAFDVVVTVLANPLGDSLSMGDVRNGFTLTCAFLSFPSSGCCDGTGQDSRKVFHKAGSPPPLDPPLINPLKAYYMLLDFVFDLDLDVEVDFGRSKISKKTKRSCEIDAQKGEKTPGDAKLRRNPVKFGIRNYANAFEEYLLTGLSTDLSTGQGWILTCVRGTIKVERIWVLEAL